MSERSVTSPALLMLDGDEYELIPKRPSTTAYQVEGLLEDDTTARQPTRRRGLMGFIRAKPVIGVALLCGTAGSIGCFTFTYWLSRHILSCPHWALECEVPRNIQLFVDNKAQVQGFLSAIFGLSVFMLAYATYQLAETTIWPVILRQSLKLKDIDAYLAASRGSILSAAEAMLNIRGGRHFIILSIVLGVALLLQINAIIVGYAFERVSIPTTYISNHSSGGGMGFSFVQYQPPGAYPGAVGRASIVYESWATGYSSEPMQEQRDFIVDRSNLTDIGNATISAAKVEKTVTCTDFNLSLNGSEMVDKADWQFGVRTSSGDRVLLRMQSAMGVWIDSKGNRNTTSGWANMVFANVNGSIEGGTSIPPTKKMKERLTSGISVIACNISVVLVDDDFCVGQCRPNDLAILSTLDTLGSPGVKADNPSLNVSQIATWLSVAPSTYGVSIHGSQHMFTKSSRLPFNDTIALPRAYTSRSNGAAAASWSQAEIQNFIDIGIGALAMNIPTSATISQTKNVTVQSILTMPRLQTKRSFFLLVPPVVVLASVVVLAILSAHMHTRDDIPLVRLGSVDEIIIAGQTERTVSYTHLTLPTKRIV